MTVGRQITIALHLQRLTDLARLPHGLLHWMMSTHGLYIYGGLLKKIIDPVSAVPLGDVDIFALDATVMKIMTSRFGIVFRRVC